MPVTIDRGLAHEPHSEATTVDPAMWILPEAIAPAAAPSASGVTIEATPNTLVHVRCHADPRSPHERNANAAPRSTIPAIAIEKGTYRAKPKDANAAGNAASKPVRTKI